MKATITRVGFYHVENAPRRDTFEGLTVRAALKKIRTVNFGNIGEAVLELSDGDVISIELTPAVEQGCQLMASQRGIRRRRYQDGSEEITGRYIINT